MSVSTNSLIKDFAMGWSIDRIVEEQRLVGEEVTCSICTDIVEDPVQTPCQHLFCRECISSWLEVGNSTCPTDREYLTASALIAPPRIIQRLVDSLTVRCENYEFGCSFVTKIDSISKLVAHQNGQCRVAKCNGLQKQVDVMRKKIVDHERYIIGLQQRLKERTERISQLQRERDSQAVKITELEIRKDNQEEIIAYQKTKLSDQEKEIEEMSMQIADQVEMIDKLESTVTEQEAKIKAQEEEITVQNDTFCEKESVLSQILKQNIDTNRAIEKFFSKKRQTQTNVSPNFNTLDNRLTPCSNFQSSVASNFETFQIFVRFWDDRNGDPCNSGFRTMTIFVKRSDYIRDLKVKIDEKERIPISTQRLRTTAGKSLEDHLTIADYNIQKESNLQLDRAFDRE